MTKLKDARVAAAVTVVVVVLSLWLGVFRTVTSRANQLEEMFYNGVDGSGYGIHGDLLDRMEYAGVFLKIAAKYDGADAEYAALEAALLNSQGSPDASVSEKYALDAELESAMIAMDLRLQELPLSEQDEGYRSQYMQDFESRGLQMSREAANFNAEVREFEAKVMGGLPVKLIGWLLPLPETEAFQ